MSETAQSGWTRLRTVAGRYEYQFQGEMPAVRAGEYQSARDYQFLVMDEEGWLYKIPVRMMDDASAAFGDSSQRLRAAEAQLRAGLETYRPRQGAAYQDLDPIFTIDLPRAKELAGKFPSA